MIDWQNLMGYEQLWITLSSSTLLFLKLTIFHFPFQNRDLFNPNDRGNWSAWATALLQCRTCVRTIRGNSAENSLFKQKVYCKWNELIFLQKLIHNVCSLKALFQRCEASWKEEKKNGSSCINIVFLGVQCTGEIKVYSQVKWSLGYYALMSLDVPYCA